MFLTQVFYSPLSSREVCGEGRDLACISCRGRGGRASKVCASLSFFSCGNGGGFPGAG